MTTPTSHARSTAWIVVAIVGAVAILAAVAYLAVLVLRIDHVEGGQAPEPEPTGEAAIPDGEWFGFVTVGELDGETILGIDLAEMLTGEAARQAAISDGVIGPGEDLPNDFYIDNDEIRIEFVGPSADARFTLIAGDEPGATIEVGFDGFLAVTDGTYGDRPVYGVVVGEPIAMDVSIHGGEVTSAEAVYLP